MKESKKELFDILFPKDRESENYFELADKFFEKTDINMQYNNGDTLLLIACEKSRSDVIE